MEQSLRNLREARAERFGKHLGMLTDLEFSGETWTKSTGFGRQAGRQRRQREGGLDFGSDGGY